jgi:hypothetical protein
MHKRFDFGHLVLFLIFSTCGLTDSYSGTAPLPSFVNSPTRKFLSHAARKDNLRCCFLVMGVGGASSKRGGRLPAITEENLTTVVPAGHLTDRFLLLGRKESLQEAWSLELTTMGASKVEEGLWKTEKPLSRAQLSLLTSVKAEIVPLSGLDGIKTVEELSEVLHKADIHAQQ